MKKAYTFRLDMSLMKQLDMFVGTRTHNITNAIQLYLQDNDNGNTKYMQHLEEEVLFLRNQNTALTVTKYPRLLQPFIDMVQQKK